MKQQQQQQQQRSKHLQQAHDSGGSSRRTGKRSGELKKLQLLMRCYFRLVQLLVGQARRYL